MNTDYSNETFFIFLGKPIVKSYFSCYLWLFHVLQLYRRFRNVVYLYMSADATCLALGNKDSPFTMELNRGNTTYFLFSFCV